MNIFKNLEIKISLITHSDWKCENFHSWLLVGNENFLERMKTSLAYLLSKDIVNYTRIKKWIKNFIYFPEQDGISINSKKKTCYIGEKKINHPDLDWYCSSLVHEATHSMIQNRFKLKWLSKENEERLCVNSKLRCYRKLGHEFDIKQAALETMELKWYSIRSRLKRAFNIIRRMLLIFILGLINCQIIYSIGFKANQIRSIIDALGNATTYEYDSANQLIKEIYADGGEVSYIYTDLGKINTLTDQNGNTTTFGYDSRGRLTSETDPEGNITQYQYDKESNVIQRITANNLTLNYSYDALDRLIQKTTPEQSYNFGYDNLGRLINAENAVSDLGFTYDSTGNLIQTDTTYSAGVSATISYTYNNANRLATMNDPTGNTAYGYDNVGRMTSITDPFNNNFNINYDIAGRRTSLSGSGGISKTYSYDQANRLLNLINKINGNTIDSFTHEYDGVGNKTKTIDNDGEHDYGYDDVYRLLSATNELESFEYDSGGNRTSDIEQSFAHNTVNQITSGTNSLSLAYDNNGNMTSKVENGVTWIYTWNSENQLIQASSSDGKIVDYSYDALGRRASLTSSGSTAQFIYDKQEILLEYEDNQLVKRYTNGPNIDEHLSFTNVVAGSSYFYHTDSLGSTTVITDQNGNIVETYDFSVYGVPEIRNNQEIVIDESVIGNRYLYTGRELDSITGLYYYRARYYDPSLGRFISKDPIGFDGGINIYSYTSNNPINWIDPLGLDEYDTTTHTSSTVMHKFRSGLFIWYGTSGGPFWTLGYEKSWEELTEEEKANAPKTQDKQDSYYLKHDKCYSSCRKRFRCDSKKRKECYKECDKQLISNLKTLGDDSSNNYHAKAAIAMFKYRVKHNMYDSEE